MKIGGIGTISRKVILDSLTVEERRAVREGLYPIEAAARYYKIQRTAEKSKLGDCQDFYTARSMLSDRLLEDLTPEQLAEIIDTIDEMAQIINTQADEIARLKKRRTKK